VVIATGFFREGELMRFDELKDELANLDREVADYLKKQEKERARLFAELNEAVRMAKNIPATGQSTRPRKSNSANTKRSNRTKKEQRIDRTGRANLLRG
jgi:chromatin segregation and condensation protein Rec8/ScpA/Scc1 (kleisin family)